MEKYRSAAGRLRQGREGAGSPIYLHQHGFSRLSAVLPSQIGATRDCLNTGVQTPLALDMPDPGPARSRQADAVRRPPDKDNQPSAGSNDDTFLKARVV
jgi:hypothetical protein